MHINYRSACNTWWMEPSEPAIHLFIPHPCTNGIWFGQDTHVSILISSYLEMMAFLQSVLMCCCHCLSLYLLASSWLPSLGLIREPLFDLQGPMPCHQRAVQLCMLLLRNPESSDLKEAVISVSHLMCHFFPEPPEFGGTIILQLSLLPYTSIHWIPGPVLSVRNF